MKQQQNKHNFFEHLSAQATNATGSTAAIVIAFGAVISWAALGPVFHYSDDWQLVINTSTTIITFLVVFLIQKAQNKESVAVQLKLNELVAAHEFASNRLVDVENMTEADLKVIQKYYMKLKIDTQNEESLQQEVAGEILQRANTVLVMGDPESNGTARPTEWKEAADFFNTGTIRVRRVFPAINLHKFTHTDLNSASAL